MTHFNLKPKIEYSQTKCAIYMRDYRAKHPEYVKQNVKQRNSMRLKVMDILGGRKCVDCGYDKDVRVLHLDHIDGKGGDEVRLFGSFFAMYRYYYKNQTIALMKLQVLCANCNLIKQHNNKEWKSHFRKVGSK